MSVVAVTGPSFSRSRGPRQPAQPRRVLAPGRERALGSRAMPRPIPLALAAALLSLSAAPSSAQEPAPAPVSTGLTATVAMGGGGELGLDSGKAGVLEIEAAVGYELTSVGLRPELALAFGLAPDTNVALRP